MNAIRLTVNAIPPSNNKYLGNSHNFNEYRREKEKWRWLVRAAIQEKPARPFDRATVSITYHFSDRRRRDPDNYSGKFILDALVRDGVIRDDSFDCVILRIEQGEPDRKRPHVDVVVSEELGIRNEE